MSVVGIVVILVVVFGIMLWRELFTPEGQARAAERVATEKNATAQIVCKFCHEKGGVTRRTVQVKKGIDGTKAAGAVVTGGVSTVFTGLSRREPATELVCSNCKSKWHED